MALTDYDKQTLTTAQQAHIQQYTAAWEKANSEHDEVGKALANAQANAVRASAGYTGGNNGITYQSVDSGSSPGQAMANSLRDYASQARAAGNAAGYSTGSSLYNEVMQQIAADNSQQLLAQQQAATQYQQQAATQYQQQLASQRVEYEQQLAAQQAEFERQQREAEEYLRRQKAAELESALTNLGGAYQKSMAGYTDQEARLPQQYDAARNAAAVRDALSRQQFDERAVAAGLGSGTSAQAELLRSAAYQNAISGYDQSEANALADLALQKANTTADYESTVAAAKAQNDASLTEALYQELLREQEWAREDQQLAQQYAAQSDATRASQLATLANMGLGVGDLSGYAAFANSLGVDTDDFLERAAAQNQIQTYTPTFTASQAYQAAENARKNGTALTGNMLRDYNYYMYGDPDYGATGAAAGTASRAASSGGTRGGGVSYNNGTLTAAQVRELQGALGVTQDGYFGPASQAAAQLRYGTTSANEAWSQYQSSFDDYTAAVNYMKQNGVPSSNASAAMTRSEWTRRKSSYNQYGTGGAEVTAYDTYAEYLTAYVQYCLENYSW